MSLHSIRFASRWLCVALAIAGGLFVSPSAPAWAEEPSADEILKKSQEAMQPPIQYRIHSANGDLMVSQKKMPDGTIAIRTETQKPIHKITLRLGSEYYDVYPTQGIAVDTQFMFQGAKAQAAPLSSTLDGLPANSSKIMGTVVRDGRGCYEIVTAIPSEAMVALRKALPENVRNMLPTGNRFVIDKETMLMVEMETLTDANSPTMKMEYKDIVLKPDLSDELFLLPIGVEVRKPKSIREEVALHTEIIRAEVDALYPAPPRLPPIVAVPIQPPKHTLPTLGPIKIDIATGRTIPPVPPGMSQLEFDVLTTPPKPPLKMPPNYSWFRWILILLPLFAVLGFLTVSRSKASRAALEQAK